MAAYRHAQREPPHYAKVALQSLVRIPVKSAIQSTPNRPPNPKQIGHPCKGGVMQEKQSKSVLVYPVNSSFLKGSLFALLRNVIFMS
jgi:hypothetical protein